MSIPHFFIDEIYALEAKLASKLGVCVSVEVGAEVIEHMYTRRMRIKEQLILVVRPGLGFRVELAEAISKKSATVLIIVLEKLQAVQTTQLCLCLGISAAERMDQSLRQVSELGVARIIPLKSERSNVRLDDSVKVRQKLGRWQRIAKSAVEQSGQFFMPQIDAPATLVETLDKLSEYDLLVMFWEESPHSLLAPAFMQLNNSADSCKTAIKKVAIFIGPEGGFSADEAKLIIDRGAKLAGLGNTILRSETAAVVACALSLYHMGAYNSKEQE